MCCFAREGNKNNFLKADTNKILKRMANESK